MLYGPNYLPVVVLLEVAAIGLLVAIAHTLALWHSFSLLAPGPSARRWIQACLFNPLCERQAHGISYFLECTERSSPSLGPLDHAVIASSLAIVVRLLIPHFLLVFKIYNNRSFVAFAAAVLIQVWMDPGAASSRPSIPHNVTHIPHIVVTIVLVLGGTSALLTRFTWQRFM